VAEERDRLFDVVLAEAPGYADYQRQTSRVLPVVVLHPEDPDVVRVRAAGDEFVALHGWFRQELAALRSGAEVDFTDDLRSNCLAFCVGLERHHMGEDYAVFSFLQQRFPELGPALEQLRAEHVKGRASARRAVGAGRAGRPGSRRLRPAGRGTDRAPGPGGVAAGAAVERVAGRAVA